MNKVKKSVEKPIKSKRKLTFPFRTTDAVLLLAFGLFAAINFSLFQDLKQVTTTNLQEEQRLHAQMAGHIAQELEDLRHSVRELQIKINTAKKAAPAPKGKKLSQVDADEIIELGPSVHLEQIKALLSQAQQTTSSRGPASVDGEEHSKSWSWVFSQIGLSLSWMCVIGAIVVLILKMLGADSGRKDP